jgi:SEFIR domain
MPRIFISYSHDSEEHKERVRDLAFRLRSVSGLSVIIDNDVLPSGPSEGWPLWSEAQVRDADKLLIACTESYYKRYEGLEAPGTGLGSVCEARAIRQLIYNTSGINQKFRVITFAEADNSYIPVQLQGYYRFPLYNPNTYDELITWLTGYAPVPVTAESHVAVQWLTSLAGHQWSLADRQEIFRAFERVIAGQSTRRILLVSGSSNKGKTALMSELHAYVRELNAVSVLVDFKGCPSMDNLFQSLRLDLGPTILKNSYHSSGTARFHELIADFQRLVTPLLLIFDTYEQASDNTQKWIESQLLLRLSRWP